MWESLATTRRQDRALHGAAKIFNLALAAVLFPLWAAGQALYGPLAKLLDRGRITAMLPTPAAGGDRDLDSILHDLRAMPHRLRASRWTTLRKGWTDYSLFLLTQKRQTVNLAYRYPRQFEYHYFEGADGERIAAEIATHDEPRPGLVVVHGLFSSRLFDYVREIAVRAYYDWGFNVAAIDLRSFGLTEMLTEAPSSAGWKEGEDILCAARYLKELGSPSVGALGISLGSSSVMSASHRKGAEKALDGGILAIAGPADVELMLDRLDRRLPLTHPFYGVSKAFEMMLVSKVRGLGWPEEVADFRTLMEQVTAPRYGVEPEEIYRQASARNHIAKARVPVLILHAEDDEVVPVEHARILEQAAAGNDKVRVWIVPGGGHAGFDVLDRNWTYAVYRTFFEGFAKYIPASRKRSAGLAREEAA